MKMKNEMDRKLGLNSEEVTRHRTAQVGIDLWTRQRRIATLVEYTGGLKVETLRKNGRKQGEQREGRRQEDTQGGRERRRRRERRRMEEEGEEGDG